jgi:hypothetical protein
MIIINIEKKDLNILDLEVWLDWIVHLNVNFTFLNKIQKLLTAVGFEPTLRKEQQLECCVLDHSTKLPVLKSDLITGKRLIYSNMVCKSWKTFIFVHYIYVSTH